MICIITYLPALAQTTINRQGAIKDDEKVVSQYDSLSNFKKLPHNRGEDYHHLIGQNITYIGNPYSKKQPTEYAVGDEFVVLDVLPDEQWNGALCYLKVKNVKTGKIIKVYPGALDYMNSSWFVDGHVRKLHSMYVSKKYIYEGEIYSHENADYLINCKTNTINRDIPAGTVWKCEEIQLLPRLPKDGMDLDRRSPVVFVFSNPTYGNHYAYYENSAAEACTYPFCRLFTPQQKTIASEESLHSIHNADDYIGMSESECARVFGKPIETKTSLTIVSGKREVSKQLVYSYGTVVIIKNGTVTDVLSDK